MFMGIVDVCLFFIYICIYLMFALFCVIVKDFKAHFVHTFLCTCNFPIAFPIAVSLKIKIKLIINYAVVF